MWFCSCCHLEVEKISFLFDFEFSHVICSDKCEASRDLLHISIALLFLFGCHKDQSGLSLGRMKDVWARVKSLQLPRQSPFYISTSAQLTCIWSQTWMGSVMTRRPAPWPTGSWLLTILNQCVFGWWCDIFLWQNIDYIKINARNEVVKPPIYVIGFMSGNGQEAGKMPRELL